MKYLTTKTLFASSLALALAACGGEAEEPVEVATPEPTPTAEYDPMSRDYTLSEAAAERRAAFDADAFQTEYDGYRAEIIDEVDEEQAGDANDADAGTASTTASSRDATTNMRARDDMSWSYLDRDGDGRLSVAEYAIWAIPLDPEAVKPNDTAPYLTAEQANKAADSFFYYDQNGDTYLSQREFTSARRGDDLG